MVKDKLTNLSVGIAYTHAETGSVAELEELENIVWTGKECDKGGEHIAFIL
jgi:hypothetical protein